MITSVYLAALFVPALVLARLTNVTIDDEAGDPLSGAKLTYNDDECSWTQGANCDSCDVQPDPSRAYMHTWHMSYFMDEYCTIDVQFNGGHLAYSGAAKWKLIMAQGKQYTFFTSSPIRSARVTRLCPSYSSLMA